MHSFESFWWLIFPLAWFVFGGFGMWLRYRRSRDHIDIIKTYAAQGKDPPPEVLAALRGERWPPPDVTAAYVAGRAGGIEEDMFGRMRPWRNNPLWHWKRAFLFGALAIAFGCITFIRVHEHTGVREPFIIVAIVMACLALASAASALLHERWKDR